MADDLQTLKDWVTARYYGVQSALEDAKNVYDPSEYVTEHAGDLGKLWAYSRVLRDIDELEADRG